MLVPRGPAEGVPEAAALVMVAVSGVLEAVGAARELEALEWVALGLATGAALLLLGTVVLEALAERPGPD
jgi:hypothetical protein